MVTQTDSNAVYSYPVQGGSPTRVIATGPGEAVQDVVELPAHRLLLKMHRDAPKSEQSAGEEWSIVELDTDQDGRAVGARRSLWSSHREDIEYLSASSEGRRLAFLAAGAVRLRGGSGCFHFSYSFMRRGDVSGARLRSDSSVR